MTEKPIIRWAERPRPCHWCSRLALALDDQGRPAHTGCAARAAKTTNQGRN